MVAWADFPRQSTAIRRGDMAGLTTGVPPRISPRCHHCTGTASCHHTPTTVPTDHHRGRIGGMSGIRFRDDESSRSHSCDHPVHDLPGRWVHARSGTGRSRGHDLLGGGDHLRDRLQCQQSHRVIVHRRHQRHRCRYGRLRTSVFPDHKAIIRCRRSIRTLIYTQLPTANT